MQRNTMLRGTLALGGLALACAFSVRMTLAQAQNGGAGGEPPFVAGAITGGNISSGLITIQTQSGDTGTIRVTSGTQILASTGIPVSDLKVNDQVQVQGMPTSITAASIMVGHAPGSGGSGLSGAGGTTAASRASSGMGFAAASGTVLRTSPLTISVGSGVSIVINIAPGAHITKLVPVSLNALKAGDRLVASGQFANDGTFTAAEIGVNLDAGGGSGFGGGASANTSGGNANSAGIPSRTRQR